MASVREHIANTHEAAADYHKTMAAHHGKLAECFDGMAKAAPSTDSDMYKTIAQHHGAISKAHSAHAEFHSQQAEACVQLLEDELSKRLMTDRISSIAPSDAEARFGIRAVTRSGQPDILKADVPAAFKHLVENLRDEI